MPCSPTIALLWAGKIKANCIQHLPGEVSRPGAQSSSAVDIRQKSPADKKKKKKVKKRGKEISSSKQILKKILIKMYSMLRSRIIASLLNGSG
jgi:hypothetical protein